MRINLLMLDREFYAQEVIHLLDDYDAQFLISVTKICGVSEVVREHRAGHRTEVSWYITTPSPPG